MMKKVSWNVHWLQLGIIGAIWNWVEQEVWGFKHHGALYELFFAIPKPNPPLRSKQEVKYLKST